MKPSAPVRLSLRVDFKTGFRLGPGKVELLEAIRETGSISAAGRALGMSYRRAWLLVDSMNTGFNVPVVETALGGKRGGGAQLTDAGRLVVTIYRGLERAALASATSHLKRLHAMLA